MLAIACRSFLKSKISESHTFRRAQNITVNVCGPSNREFQSLKLYRAIQCVVIMKNLQLKNGWMNLKELIKSRYSVCAEYVYHFSFRNYTLKKALFIHCFYAVVGT